MPFLRGILIDLNQNCSIPTLVTILYQFLNMMTKELLKLLMNNNINNVKLIKFYQIDMNLYKLYYYD